MPVLTKEQIVEAVMELDEDQRAEVIERVEARLHPLPQLSEEHKQIIRDEIAEHQHEPSIAISRDEIMARMQAAL